MRGPRVRHARSGAEFQAVNEATTRVSEIPAPSGGWNAVGNIANMPATDALVMDNLFPGVNTVQLRLGSATRSTGFANNVHCLMPYNGLTTQKLFAACSDGIYDATTPGVVGAAATACTNGNYVSCMTATPGGTFLVAVNGADNLKLFDGTTWNTITGVSTPAITGVNTNTFKHVSVFKHRLWLVPQNSLTLYYLDVDSIGGIAHPFPMNSLFKHGGYLVATGDWTLDSGNGSDDYFAVCTSEGELALYQGTDPSSATTWALIGVYDVGKPIGNRPFIDYGGDLLYLCNNGLLPLSRLTQSVIIDRSQQTSFKIDGAFLDATSQFSGNYGWQPIIYKEANFLLVNIPVQNDTVSYQYVMNTITKSWCRFLGWNASCFATVSGKLYFGAGKTICQAWTGTSDSGLPINAVCAQAYNPLGGGGQKHVQMARANFGVSAAAIVTMAFDADYKAFQGSTNILYNSLVTAAVWDTSLWNQSIWDPGLQPVEPKWSAVPSDLGYKHSLRIQITTSTAAFQWNSVNVATQPAGIL